MQPVENQENGLTILEQVSALLLSFVSPLKILGTQWTAGEAEHFPQKVSSAKLKPFHALAISIVNVC